MSWLLRIITTPQIAQFLRAIRVKRRSPHTHTYTHTHTHIPTHTHTRTNTHTHTDTRTHRHTHAHTDTHRYPHTQTERERERERDTHTLSLFLSNTPTPRRYPYHNETKLSTQFIVSQNPPSPLFSENRISAHLSGNNVLTGELLIWW